MALHEQSMSLDRLEPPHPLRDMIALDRRAKLILVRMYVVASEYDSSFFKAILRASCFIVHVADGPAPQCRKTRAERSYSSRRQVFVAHTSGSYFRQVFVAHTSGTSTTHDTCTLLRSFSGMTWLVG